MVIFAADHHESVRCAIDGRERFERSRRAALRILLVHPIEQRQLQRDRINQARSMTARDELLLDELRRFDALTVCSYRSDEDDDVQGHCGSTIVRGVASRTASTWSSRSPR